MKEDIFPTPANLSSKLFWFIAVPLLSAVLGGIVVYMITEGKLPAVLASDVNIATTTPNIADIFYRLNKIDRPIDQRTFLTQYNGTQIVGRGYFNYLGGSREDKNYWLHTSVKTGFFGKENIACMFRNGVDETTEKRLDLLKNGQGILFIGTFTNSSLFGSNAWVVDDCQLLDQP